MFLRTLPSFWTSHTMKWQILYDCWHMSGSAHGLRSHVTLVLCTLLHAFTHAYCVALVPLYLMIVADLHLGGVGAASLIVTIYGLVYCVSSYGAGVLADRFNRKMLLGVGLIGNALAVGAMGLTRQYGMLIVLGVLAGLFGTLFHPCANALVPAHYPKSPGMAIGLLGMGAGFGFFIGPQYAGWRAETATWHWGMIADWQRPCIELAAVGVIFGIIFLIFASETPKGMASHARASGQAGPSGPGPSAQEDPDLKVRLGHTESSTDGEPTEDGMLPNRVAIEAIVTDLRGPHERVHPHLTSALRKRVIAVSLILACRDFAGIASISLLSIYLQKAHDYSTKQAGLVVGSMMLLSILVNPISVYISGGRRRLPALMLVLLLAAVTIALVPLLPVASVLPAMCLFQAFQMGSYAISDAAILERVSPVVRGRVVGLFITLAGTFASLSPWAMGFWTDLLKDRAKEQSAYVPIFVSLGVLLVISTFVTPLISKLGEAAGAKTEPVTEPLGSMQAAG
jgi:MFS family permease